MHTQHLVWDDGEWEELETARKRMEVRAGRVYTQKEYVLAVSRVAGRTVGRIKRRATFHED